MKVKELVKWLEENTGPEDDIALLDLSDPSRNRRFVPIWMNTIWSTKKRIRPS